MEGIDEFVELQGSDKTVRSANAATQGFRRNFSHPGCAEVWRSEGDASRGSGATENNDSDSKVTDCWWPRKVPVRAYHPLHLLRTKPHCCGTNPVPDAPVMLQPLKIKLFLLLHVHSHCFIATSQNLFISSSLSNTTLTLSILFYHCKVHLSIAIINIWEYIFKLKSSKLLLQFSTTYILLFCRYNLYHRICNYKTCFRVFGTTIWCIKY